jgi:hypothetical protein
MLIIKKFGIIFLIILIITALILFINNLLRKGELKSEGAGSKLSCGAEPPGVLSGGTCPSENFTCCFKTDESYPCCPTKGATCCGGGICCPQDHPVCDFTAGAYCTNADQSSRVPAILS